jgi:membrane-associated phospholipid phosphatase
MAVPSGESGGVRSSPDGGRPPERGRALTAAAGCALVVALLGAGVLVGFAPQMALDGAVSEALYVGDDRAPLLDGLLELMTAPGSTVVRAVLFMPVLVWLLVRSAYRTTSWVLAALLLVAPLTELLKEAFGRVRPDFDLGGARYDSLSYPSGHSSGIATLVAVALVLAWPALQPRWRRWWLALGVALVVLVGLTRMWLGVHYLSDVLGGWALGVGWSLLVATLLGGLPGGRAALPVRERVAA